MTFRQVVGEIPEGIAHRTVSVRRMVPGGYFGQLELWEDDLYRVELYRRDGEVQLLSVARHDGLPIHSWADMQAIKNELAGPEVEAVELYPAESRLVDTANKYHLWCLSPGDEVPFGWLDRDVRRG